MIIFIDALWKSAITGKQEPTIALGFDGITAAVAERAGFGYKASAEDGLSVLQETEVGLYVDEGYRDFLLSYEWSFMKPIASSVLWATTTSTTTMTVGGEGSKTVTASVATFYPTMVGHTIVSTNGSYVIDGYVSTTVVTVTSNASNDTGEAFTITPNGRYRMPDDFGGLLGNVYFQPNEGLYIPLGNTGVAEVTHLLQGSTDAARPTMCAVEPANVSGSIGQRFDLLAWRIPDDDYTIRYQYEVLPDKLSGGAYPYGGAMHGETIKYACLAAMERSKFHLTKGPWQSQYDRLLVLSIKRDQRGKRADSLGFLVNAGASRGSWGRSQWPQCNTVSVGGEYFP